MKAYAVYLDVCEELNISPHPESAFDDICFASLRAAWIQAFIHQSIPRYCKPHNRSVATASRSILKSFTYGMRVISEQDKEELNRDKIIEKLSLRSSLDLSDFSGVFTDILNYADDHLSWQQSKVGTPPAYSRQVSWARHLLRESYEDIYYNDHRDDSDDPVERATYYVDMCAELACLAIIGCIINKAAEAYPIIYTTPPNKVGTEDAVYKLANPCADFDADSVNFIARKEKPFSWTNWLIASAFWITLAVIIAVVYFD